MKPITDPPTERQAAVLGFIQARYLLTGRAPTLREVCAFLGTSSPNGVMCHMRALIRRGLLRKDKPDPKRDAAYLPVGRIVVDVADDTVRVATCGPVTMARGQWARWLRARLRALQATHPLPAA